MGKLVDGLLAYFAKVSDEQLKKDWIELEEFNKIGPEVNKFIAQSKELDKTKIENLITDIHLINNIKNPDYNPDFFIILTAKSKQLLYGK